MHLFVRLIVCSLGVRRAPLLITLVPSNSNNNNNNNNDSLMIAIKYNRGKNKHSKNRTYGNQDGGLRSQTYTQLTQPLIAEAPMEPRDNVFYPRSRVRSTYRQNRKQLPPRTCNPTHLMRLATFQAASTQIPLRSLAKCTRGRPCDPILKLPTTSPKPSRTSSMPPLGSRNGANTPILFLSVPYYASF